MKECNIQTDLEVLIPDHYVTNITERLVLYKELNDLETDEQLETYRANLIDRFGPLPQATNELIETIRLRRTAKTLGMERLLLKNDAMVCYFVGNQDNDFYKSETFVKVIRHVQNNPKQCSLKDDKNKLSLTFKNIKSIQQALEVLMGF